MTTKSQLNRIHTVAVEYPEGPLSMAATVTFIRYNGRSHTHICPRNTHSFVRMVRVLREMPHEHYYIPITYCTPTREDGWIIDLWREFCVAEPYSYPLAGGER